MKPIFLEIKAFGAFAQKIEIDFRIYEKHKVFLIHGATGAGKTTIFDAMCYALYGETTGDRRAEDMRSQFVGKEQDTRIKFVFEVRGNFYLAERTFFMSPRAAKLEQSSAFSICDENNFERKGNVLTKKTEIENEITNIIGLSKEQFKRIIILPQGKFQEFLKASSQEKEQLLSKIFNADNYKKITEKLKEKATEFEKELKDKQQKKTILLGNFQNLDEVNIAIEKQKTQLQTLQQQLETQKAQEQEYAKIVQQAGQTHKDFLDYEKLQNKMNELLEEQIKQEEHKQKISWHEKALPLDTFFKQATEVKIEKEKINDLLNTTQTQLKEKQEKLQKTQRKKEELDAKKDTIKELQQKVAEKKRLLPKLQEVSVLEKNYLKAKQAAEHTQHQRNTVEKKQKETQEKLTQIEQRIGQLLPHTLQKESIESKLQQLEKQQIEIEKCQKLEQKIVQQTQVVQDFYAQLEKLAQEKNEAIQLFLQKEQQWRNSQAALLAMNLTDNQPCPVCGSTQHPNLAQSNEATVTNEQLEKYKKESEQKTKKYEEQKALYDQANSDLLQQKNLLEAAKEQLPPSEMDINLSLKNAKNDLIQTENAIQEVQKLQQEKEILKKQIAELTAAFQQAQTQYEKTSQEHTAAETNWKNSQKELPQPIPTEAEWKSEINRIEKEILHYETEQQTILQNLQELQKEIAALNATLQNYEKQIQELEQKRNSLLIALDQKATESGFTDKTAAFNAIIRDEAVLQGIKKSYEDYQKRWLQTTGAIQEVAKKIQNKEKPDLTAILKQSEDYKKQVEDTQKQVIHGEKDIEHAQNTLKDVETIEQECINLEKKSAPYKKLAELAEGKNIDKIPFHNFVLSAFLEEILYYANERLAILSQGRYQLILGDTKDGRKKGGLDVAVQDSYTAFARPVNNLSGGETFLASLALALGLADVITAQSGGVSLDALFIDEGFGTLDSEVLDLAIRTLMDIEQGQKLVGLISHVAELKERIPSQLEVIKGREGSKIKTIV
jgi:exonuclease SbcC